MVQWCKKVGFTAALCLLTVVPDNAKAYDQCYDTCQDACSLGGFEFGADFLYWKPCVDETDFAAYTLEGDTTTTDGIPENTLSVNYKQMCLNWEPGVRVRVAMPEVWCDWKLSASWVWVHSCDSRALGLADGDQGHYTSPLLAPGFGDLITDYVTADGSWDSTYQTWDALFSYDITCNRCNVITPFFGVEGLVLNQTLKADYETTVGEQVNSSYVKWSSDFWGVGLKIGTDYTYTLFDCMKVFARASGSLVIGDDCNSEDQGIYYQDSATITTLDSRKYKDDDKCLIVPGYHLQVGFLYESCYCGVDFGVRLGYEFVNWYNVPNQRNFSLDSTNGATPSSIRNYGMHGLLAGAEVKF